MRENRLSGGNGGLALVTESFYPIFELIKMILTDYKSLNDVDHFKF